LTKEQITLKPKILITAGLDGTEISAISTAMNFIQYIGRFKKKITFRFKLFE
jgi:predicted deacylase